MMGGRTATYEEGVEKLSYEFGGYYAEKSIMSQFTATSRITSRIKGYNSVSKAASRLLINRDSQLTLTYKA